MTQIDQAITTIIDKLQPLQEAGVLVRTVADESNAIGRLETNGVVVVSYGGDRDFNTERPLGGLSSRYTSVFAINGRLRNLRETTGYYAVRDGLYKSLLGLKSEGYVRPAQVLSFTPEGQLQGRSDTYWGFQMLLGFEGVAIACTPDEALGELPIDPIGELFKGLFLDSRVTDRWDIKPVETEPPQQV